MNVRYIEYNSPKRGTSVLFYIQNLSSIFGKEKGESLETHAIGKRGRTPDD